MKFLFAFFFSWSSAEGQRLGFGIYSGYASQSFDAFGQEHMQISDSRYSGFDAVYQLDKNFGLRLGYARQDARASPPCYSEAANTVIERYELGFTARKSILDDRLYWTTGIGFGLCRLFKDLDYPDEIKLATSFSAGFSYHISRFIGLQVQGRLLQFYSKAVSACIAVNQVGPASYGTVVSQGAVTGGLLFSIGK